MLNGRLKFLRSYASLRRYYPVQVLRVLAFAILSFSAPLACV